MQVSQRVSRVAPACSARPSVAPHPARRAIAVVRCSAQPNRREALLAAGAIAVAPFVIATGSASAAGRQVDIPVTSLGTFQKKDQRAEYQSRAIAVLKEKLSATDAQDAVRLSLRCASDYDAATKTGGFDASILLNSEELARPENALVRPFAAKLKGIKSAVDEAVAVAGYGPISYSDLMVLATKVSCEAKWRQIKYDAGNVKIIDALKNPWEVTLGRIDSSVSGTNSLPAADAPVEEIRAALLKLGTKPGAGTGPFDPKPMFWEKPGWMIWCAAAEDPVAEEARFAAAAPVYADIRKEYDVSRITITRTNYEIDFVTHYTKLCNLGAKFDPLAYLHPMTITNIMS